MLSLYDKASMESALASPLDPCLHQLLADRIHDAAETELLDLTHLLVVQSGDCEHTIAEEICLSPLTNPIDGERFGSPDFHPWWDWLQQHDGWFEMIITVGNSGFAFLLLIQDAQGVQPELLSLCRTYAEERP
jgi:hypothetical protein